MSRCHVRRQNERRGDVKQHVRERRYSDGDDFGGVEVAWPGQSEPCGRRSELTLRRQRR